MRARWQISIVLSEILGRFIIDMVSEGIGNDCCWIPSRARWLQACPVSPRKNAGQGYVDLKTRSRGGGMGRLACAEDRCMGLCRLVVVLRSVDSQMQCDKKTRCTRVLEWRQKSRWDEKKNRESMSRKGMQPEVDRRPIPCRLYCVGKAGWVGRMSEETSRWRWVWDALRI